VIKLFLNRFQVVLILGFVLLNGCAMDTTSKTVDKPDSVLVYTLPKEKGVTVPHNFHRKINGILKVSVEVINFSNNEYNDIEYRFRWYTRYKDEVGEYLSIWKPLFLDARDSKVVTALAPTPKVEKFRFYIRERK